MQKSSEYWAFIVSVARVAGTPTFQIVTAGSSTHYIVLGLVTSAPSAVIRAAHQALTLINIPDQIPVMPWLERPVCNVAL